MPRPSPIAEFADTLQSRGRLVFTREEAARASPGTSASGVAQALHRLAERGRVTHVRAGFYVIVPLEYRATGIVPPTWFIHDLMQFIGQPYYVGLLSAAAVHGAAHQQPQELQVVTTKPVRAIELEHARLVFVTNSRTLDVPAVDRKVETGSFRVSSPAATALDLVRYAGHVGGLSNVATVLSELIEGFQPEELGAYARMVLARERPALQRLGLLLSKAGARNWEDVLHAVVFPKTQRARAGGRRDTLPALLAEVPDKVFWRSKRKSDRVPNFNGVFGWYLRHLYPGRLPGSEALVHDIESGKVVNLSTFQRAVAAEARRRAPLVLLRPDLPAANAITDARWNVIVNDELEVDT